MAAELRWSTTHGVGQYLQIKKGGTGLFAVQLYPLTSVLAVETLVILSS